MSTESNLQSDIRKWLKDRGCYVLVVKGQPGVPDGCPDILFMIEGFWGAIEVKTSPTSKYQPLQLETLDKLNEWSWARCVDPSNWLSVQAELEAML